MALCMFLCVQCHRFVLLAISILHCKWNVQSLKPMMDIHLHQAMRPKGGST